jgi:DUF4097 and DUF4098 domain-containing protein YvlB
MKTRQLAFAICVATASLVFQAAAGETTVNRSVSVNSNGGNTGGEVENFRSVNGNVTLLAGANAANVANVNGDIDLLGDNAVAGISNVNGGITAKNKLRIGADISTVNGDVDLGLDSQITGELSTVNGDVAILGGTIGKSIYTVNGDVALGTVTVQGNIITTWGDVVLKGSAVMGELRVRKPRTSNYWGKDPQPPRIVIGAGARLAGVITLEQPAQIFVHQSAQVPSISGAMVGGAVVRFSGTDAPN